MSNTSKNNPLQISASVGKNNSRFGMSVQKQNLPKSHSSLYVVEDVEKKRGSKNKHKNQRNKKHRHSQNHKHKRYGSESSRS